MVQEFRVLQCYSCSTFQVDQVKKSSTKWLCKICQEKQSVKHVYFQGSAKDCRTNSQMLNMRRQTRTDLENEQTLDKEEEDEEEIDEEIDEESSPFSVETPVVSIHEQKQNKRSKWANYVEENNVEINETESTHDGIAIKFRGEEGTKTKKKRSLRVSEQNGIIKLRKPNSNNPTLKHLKDIKSKMNSLHDRPHNMVKKSQENELPVFADMNKHQTINNNCIPKNRWFAPVSHSDANRREEIPSKEHKLHKSFDMQAKQTQNSSGTSSSTSSKWGKFLTLENKSDEDED